MRHSGRSALAFALALATLPVAAPAAAQQAVTLDAVLSAPFATELVAAHRTGRVAWVQNVLGERNIWIADPPAYEARQLTRFAGDDGRRIAQLAFTPDGGRVFFVRGGAQSGGARPEPPNPSLQALGSPEEVWYLEIGSAETIRVGPGTAPAVSPASDLVAFLRSGQIWAAPLDVDRVGEPTIIVRDRGSAAGLRWSPDGRRLAYVSRRGDHAYIGVYSPDDSTLVYLDPSLQQDQAPAWSPDGTELAFIRVASDPGSVRFVPQRTAQPWSIRVAEAGTGAGREVWRANEGHGSAFWGFMNNEDQLFWADGDRLVFPWESTGWVHLYSVPVSGGAATALTAGEFEVEHVALSPDRGELSFSSNQDDTDRRHLWRVAVAGGTAVPVTAGDGIEYWPVWTGEGRTLAFLASGARIPPRVELVRLEAADDVPGGGRQVLAPDIAPEQFPAASLVEPQQVVFPSLDGLEIHGQLFLPAGYSPERTYPAVLYFHGGSRAQMVLGYHYHRIDYYQKMYGFNQYLANRGYIVLSVNYRSGTGYGMEFREALGYGGGGGSEVQDVIAAGRWLRARPDVDPRRIGLWGGSYGGYLTAMGLARASDLFAAGVDLHGVHSWDARIDWSPWSRMEVDEAREIARNASPIGNVDTWTSPVLFVHGDDDRNVDFDQTVALAAELRRRGVPVEELVIPNEVHSFLLHSSWVRAFEAAADFFERHLLRASSRATDGHATARRR